MDEAYQRAFAGHAVQTASFRGVDFTKLPREVVRHTRQDFDTVCGAMAEQLASLFAFLKSDQAEESEMGGEELALYADPSYWLYGLLSFCAKSCEAKTAEVGGQPIFKTSKEGKKDCTPVSRPGPQRQPATWRVTRKAV